MPDDLKVQVTRGFWGELFTAPRLITFAFGLFVLGTYVQGLRSDIASLRERITTLEIVMPRDYQRKDTIDLQFRVLADEQLRLRQTQERMADSIDKLRKDLR